jgi:signal transduction histidine kinase
LMGSWEYDMETGCFHWSEGMYRLFGLPAGSPVTLQTYLDTALAEDLPVVERIYHHLTRNHVPFDETLRIQVSGQVLTLKVRATVLRGNTGEPVKMLGIDLDISEVRRLEQENLQMRLNQQKALLIGILEAQEEERRRISESLHNGVGQVLYATKLNLDQVVQTLPPASRQDNQALEKTQHLLNDAIQETRRVSHELVPMVLRDFGLVYGIKDLCRKFNGGALELECEIEGFEEKLESYMVIALYRISQELINNIVKHAQATRAKLVLEQEQGEITLKVWDNGQGFPLERGKKKGIGLQTISDRVKLLNGTLALSTPDTGRGTLIHIKIPLS